MEGNLTVARGLQYQNSGMGHEKSDSKGKWVVEMASRLSLGGLKYRNVNYVSSTRVKGDYYRQIFC